MMCLPSFSSESVFVDLKVKQSKESLGVPVSLPKENLEQMRLSVVGMAKAILACKNSSGSFTNPLINRMSTYSTKPSSLGCSFKLNSHSVRTYSCYLSDQNRKEFAAAITKRALTDELVGDYSDKEKSILFDRNMCTTE
jgi:hypothetical protein